MKLIIIGAGGHAKVVTDSARMSGWDVIGFVDDRPNAQLFDLPNLGPLNGLRLFQKVNAVVAIGLNRVRQKVVSELSEYVDWATIIHPSAVVSNFAKIRSGSVVFAGAIIQADTVIGHHCIVKSSASIDHDCRIADFCHVAPNAVIAGGVSLETGVFVGAGSVIIPGLHIGAWATLGAGSVSLTDLDADGIFVGVPAKLVKSS